MLATKYVDDHTRRNAQTVAAWLAICILTPLSGGAADDPASPDPESAPCLPLVRALAAIGAREGARIELADARYARLAVPREAREETLLSTLETLLRGYGFVLNEVESGHLVLTILETGATGHADCPRAAGGEDEAPALPVPPMASTGPGGALEPVFEPGPVEGDAETADWVLQSSGPGGVTELLPPGGFTPEEGTEDAWPETPETAP